jgi:hypothetical protein
MTPARRVGRIIGTLLFVQLAGLILPFILLMPMTRTGFLESAAGLAAQIYCLLFRLSLVPRRLAGFGLLMVVVHAAGVTLPMFVGYGSVPPMGFSLALSHVALGSRLVAKGFDEAGPTPPRAERGVELSGA